MLAAIGGIVMSDSTKSQPAASPEEKTASAGTTSLDEILKDAQAAMSKLAEIVESAKTAEAAAAESKRLTATAPAESMISTN